MKEEAFMNYGKRKASKKQKRITSKKNMHKKKLGVRLFKGFLLCIFVCCILAAIGGGFIIKHVIDNAPEITADSIKPQGYTSTALADDGTTTIAEFTGAGANRVYKTIDQIPKDLQHAFVAIEDSLFYKHNGIDIQGIIRAFVVGITHGGNFSEGASTITQQLAKNLYFTQEKKMERKVAEVFMAFALERDYSKNEILELYVNTIYFGNGYYCIKDASEGYFGKEPEDLTDYESTLLAGVPNAPSKYSPTVNLELAEKRQEQVVERLVACGLFTKERALETLAGSEM